MNQPIDGHQLGTGETAQLILDKNWEDSPLGTPDEWPQSLRTVVSLMLNSKFPMFVAWGNELGFIYNDAYSDVLGQKHPSAMGQRFADVWPEIWTDVSPIVDKAMSGESSYFEDLPLTMFRKGFVEQTWFTFSYSPVFDETGTVAGVYCACTETTSQVLAERRRKHENERLKDFFKQAPGIMAVLRDEDHTFELANEAYYQLVGHRQLTGRSVREALPEVEGQGLFELLDQVYSSGEPYLGRAVPIKLKRGDEQELEQRYVDFVYQPIRDNAGNVSGIFIEGSDVTEAVQATQALQESEQRLRQLANTIPQMAWMASPDGYIHWFNDRFYEYTGTTYEQVKGWGWQRVHRQENIDSIVNEYKRLIEKGEPFEVAEPLRSATGKYRTFFTKAAPLYDYSGNIVQWFGTNTDIHEIEQAQEELRVANRRKDEFLAMLAHELRNPLAPVSTAAEILKMPGLDQQQVHSASAVISRQVNHMTELVDDLLDVSRVTRGLANLHRAPVDINNVIVDAIEQISHMATEKHHRLFAAVAEAPVYVMGDRTRLVQVFSNILNNAARYTQDGGEINVRVKALDNQVQICITDTGLGIEPQLLPHVFELFTQAERSPDRSQGGLGLGLALVKSLVELHGGTVSAESEGMEKGSAFEVILPCIAAPDEMQGNTTPPVITTQRVKDAKTVLVVDDNIDAAQTLCLLLESYGYTALPRYTATEALIAIQQTQPDAIILDIGLPDIDGYELARRVQLLPEAAAAMMIALTGYGQNSDRDQSKAAGFSHHLVKPVNTQELLSVLAKVHE